MLCVNIAGFFQEHYQSKLTVSINIDWLNNEAKNECCFNLTYYKLSDFEVCMNQGLTMDYGIYVLILWGFNSFMTYVMIKCTLWNINSLAQTSCTQFPKIE